MQVKIFAIRDDVAGQSEMLLTSTSPELLFRDLKNVFASGQANPIVRHYEDKKVYCVGELYTEEGKIIGLANPEYCYSLNEVYRSLLGDIKRQNELLKENGLPTKEEGEIDGESKN